MRHTFFRKQEISLEKQVEVQIFHPSENGIKVIKMVKSSLISRSKFMSFGDLYVKHSFVVSKN